MFLKFSREEIQQKNDRTVFSGIFGYFDIIDSIGWMEDSRHIIFNSISGGEVAAFVVDTFTKEVSKLSPPSILSTSSWRLLSKGPFSDTIIFSFENSKHSILPKIAIVSNLIQVICKRKGDLSACLAEISSNMPDVIKDQKQNKPIVVSHECTSKI